MRLTQIDLPGQKYPVEGEASISFCCFRNKLVNGTVSRGVPSLQTFELSIGVADLPGRSMSDGNIEDMFQRTLVVLYFEPGVHWLPQAGEISTLDSALYKKKVDIPRIRHARKGSDFESIALGQWRD